MFKILELSVDIIAGNDVSSVMPFNSFVVYSRINDFRVNFEKETIEKFTSIMSNI